MIARGCKRVVNPRKDRSTIMQDFTRFSMHNIWRTYDFSAKCLADRLVPQANTEDRNFTGEAVNEIECDPCLIRFAGPGRDDNPLRREPVDLIERYPVIARH